MRGLRKPVDTAVINGFKIYCLAIEEKMRSELPFPNEESIDDLANQYSSRIDNINLSSTHELFNWDKITSLLESKQCVD